MPKGFNDFEVPDNWLTFDEIERVIAAFAELGVAHVRITGGEPLVRKGIEDLSSRLSSINGITDLSLSTNGIRLRKIAPALAQAGIGRINVSLDTLQKERFQSITGGKIEKVFAGLEAARNAGLAPIKLNMVAMKGVNDDEYIDVAQYCMEKGFSLRFIETMPMGSTGQDAVDHYVSLEDVKHQLQQRFELIPSTMPGAGPAKYYQVAGSELKIGFITPISQHFCDTCNRVRLSVDGTLYMCLGQSHNYPLRDLLRRGIPQDELIEAIRSAIELKPERHEFNEKPRQVIRIMSVTGG
jgi:cyclic pyranopterin phosphate synthase